LSDFELLHGSAEFIADLLGCSVRTARRYKNGSTELPEPCRRLLRLRRCGDLSALLGSAWDGFGFDAGGLLYVPGWRNGWPPERIKAMFFTFQEASALRAQVKALKSELWAWRSLNAVVGGAAASPNPARGSRATPP
jgi:hypothetical protein